MFFERDLSFIATLVRGKTSYSSELLLGTLSTANVKNSCWGRKNKGQILRVNFVVGGVELCLELINWNHNSWWYLLLLREIFEIASSWLLVFYFLAKMHRARTVLKQIVPLKPHLGLERFAPWCYPAEGAVAVLWKSQVHQKRHYNAPVATEPFLNGSSSAYVEEMYNAWLRDPKSVHVVSR